MPLGITEIPAQHACARRNLLPTQISHQPSVCAEHAETGDQQGGRRDLQVPSKLDELQDKGSRGTEVLTT